MMSDDLEGSKGLWLPAVSLPGVGHMPAKGEDKQEAAQVFYVAASRATKRCEVGAVGGLGRSLTIGPATALSLFPTLV